ncbi:MAG: hypothetical protein Q4D96_06735 [Propionibacteriaceae bacterium]|nr:hypothetical protein [Propionibacteriaceae bacterium]
MTTLEAQTPIAEVFGMAFLGIMLLGASLVSFRFGWKAYSGPKPRFTTHYSGGSCPPLSLFYNGIFTLCMALATMKSFLPQKAGGFLGLIALPCALIFIIGYFFWFPRFLLPRWYRRAVKVGIPRHDPFLMGTFKALPSTEQLELLHHTGAPSVAPVVTPAAAPVPATPPSAERFSTSVPAAWGGSTPQTDMGVGITSGLTSQDPAKRR